MEVARIPDVSALGPPVVVLAHLSGSRRGQSDRISGDTLLVGTAPESHVRLAADHDPAPGPVHAVLRRRGLTYEIEAAAKQKVWVNGEPIEKMVLASSDRLLSSAARTWVFQRRPAWRS